MSKSITSLNSLKSRHNYVVDVALTDLTKLLAPSKSLYVRNKGTLNFLTRREINRFRPPKLWSSLLTRFCLSGSVNLGLRAVAWLFLYS